MHIRKLELQGFKSFVDRTTFSFGDGIAGVVGPNGCGKSNVIDAIKWCIGEQSAKSLRGGSMEDVIFAGSASRKKVGFAEVTITFACGDEPFPGHWARFEELSVTRRLFREGGSQYLINQNKVRLKDIHDLFLDTGVGNRLYSFIEQGRIDEVVKARPEQRRLLIEEAAGISRFKERRKEALGKLDHTEQNLARAADLEEEMRKRLRSLERQVLKAIRFRRLSAELKNGEIFLGLARYAGLAGDRKALSRDLQVARREEESLNRELERRDGDLAQRREEAQVVEHVVGRLRDELGELEAQRRAEESARIAQGRQKDELERRIGVLEHDLDEAQAHREEGAAEAERLGGSLAAVETELVQHAGALSAAETESGQLEAAVRTARDDVERLKKRTTRALQDVASHKARLRAAEERQLELFDEKERHGQDLELAERELERLEASLTAERSVSGDLESRLAEAKAAVDAAREARADGDRQLGKVRAELQQAEKAVTAAERQVARLEARTRSLQDLAESHAGVDADAKSVLDSVPGALGTLAEQLDVPEDLVGVLGVALDGALDHVVVPNDATLLQAAAAARGRIGLVRPGAVGDGLASGLGGSTEGIGAAGRVLGDCRRVATLAEALALHDRHGCRVVVDTGELVLENGVVLAGQPGRSSGQAILERRRELAGLEAELERESVALQVLRDAADGLQALLDALRASQQQARQAFDTASNALRSVELEGAEARHRVKGREQEVARQRAHLDRIREQASRLDARRTSLGDQADKSRAGIAAAEERLGEDEVALKHAQAALMQLDEQARSSRDVLADARARKKSLAGRRAELATALEAAKRRAEQGEARHLRASQELVRTRARIAELGAEDGRIAKLLQELGEAQGEKRTKLDGEKKQLAALRERLQVVEDALREQRAELDRVRASRTRLELSLQEVKGQVEAVREQISQRHQLSLPALLDKLDRQAALVLEIPSSARLELPFETRGEVPEVDDLRVTPPMLESERAISSWVARVGELRERIAKLGDVNLAALTEYEDVRERHGRLEQQTADLAESVEEIRRAIAKLNRTCRERFRETFDRVDGYFREIYPRLVGGGSARLALTDEDDLLETGVEIYVQPPGKRLQSLSLMSGGEKAMTALGLVFALFQVKPSPFCLLDEVDAPLDEQNGQRFNDMLREFCRNSQFIVITHNRKTIESVDTLYGVTMPDPGVSRLVTVRVQ